MKQDRICELLGERYGELGRGASARLRQWLSGKVPYAYPEILDQHLEEKHLALLFDAFWQVLPFGTGGRRGRVGYGPNRLNPTTVAMTVQGHCQYLRAAFPNRNDLAVVVANDVRVFNDVAGVYHFLGKDHPLLGVSSRSLGKLACEIYAGNGITAYFAEPGVEQAVLTTPELSFTIERLGAVGGINLSASHNPPDDNGLKVYDQYGSQPVAPNDQRLVEIMEQATDVRLLPFDRAFEQGLIREIPKELHQEYIETYVKLYDNIYTPRPDAPIVYTPLCGCGLTTVYETLEELKFPVVTPPDEGPDGSFSIIPFKAPNPEVPQATEPAKAFAESKDAEIVLSSDPDADRVGLEIRLTDGSWYHFDGNQIAAILCYYLMLDPEGPQRRGLVIETLVTTRILGKIVEKAGDSWLIDDLLVGFKYVADALKELAKPAAQRKPRYAALTCSPAQLVLATEESHGVVMVPTILDKDSTPACMYLAALYQRLRKQNQTLLDYYVRILEELGGYDDVNRSIMMVGAEGVSKRDRIMDSLRKSPPEELCGYDVRRIVDYWDQNPETFGPFVSETDKLPRNVIQITTEAFIVTVRPSGTEPKLKFYCQLLPHGEPSPARGMELLQEVRAKAEPIARSVYEELLARIGLSLGEAGLLLPDIVDLDRKQNFEQQTIPQLREVLAQGTFARLDDLLAWLRKEAAAMTPGADPLPALKAPLAYLCDRWVGELGSKPLFTELESWAKQR
jgi:phosphoglucomutase/phosphomannomutase